METKVVLLGDFAAFDNGLLGRNWKQGLKSLKEYLMSFDLVIANLEVPITNIDRSYVPKGIHIKSDEKIVNIHNDRHSRNSIFTKILHDNKIK